MLLSLGGILFDGRLPSSGSILNNSVGGCCEPDALEDVVRLSSTMLPSYKSGLQNMYLSRLSARRGLVSQICPYLELVLPYMVVGTVWIYIWPIAWVFAKTFSLMTLMTSHPSYDDITDLGRLSPKMLQIWVQCLAPVSPYLGGILRDCRLVSPGPKDDDITALP